MTQYRKYGSRYPEIEKYKSISENAYSNTKLNSVGMKHVNKLVVTHLNINSPKIEFEFLTEFVKVRLMISEIKIDKIFTLSQFVIASFNTTVLTSIAAVRVLSFLFGKLYHQN